MALKIVDSLSLSVTPGKRHLVQPQCRMVSTAIWHSSLFFHGRSMKKNPVLPLLLLFLTNCTMPLQPDPTLPDAELFREGDIVITADGGVESWLIALAARSDTRVVKTPFSHSEMIFRNTDNQLMIGGVFSGKADSELLEDRFKKFHRAAVFRAITSQDSQIAAARVLQEMLTNTQIQNAQFDYSMSYEPGKTDQLFCAGIINESWQRVGLSTPFGPRQWHPNPFTRHVEEIMGNRMSNLLDLDSLYKSKDFSLVLEWENDQINTKRTQLSRKIVHYLLEQYELGFRLKESKEPNLLLALGGLSEEVEKLARVRISLTLFNNDVTSTWQRLERRGILEKATDDEKDNLIEAIFSKYHENYFYPAPAAAPDQQLHATTLPKSRAISVEIPEQ